jgi:hypothetical protein
MVKIMATKIRIVKKLTDNSPSPTKSKYYKIAHSEADNAEKRKFPEIFNKLKKIDKKLEKHELIGKNFKSGKIEIESKLPKKYRKDVALHEKTERKAINRLSRKFNKK